MKKGITRREREVTDLNEIIGILDRAKIVHVGMVDEGKPYIVDYKTTESCENGHFERSAQKYGYQFQAGMYCEGVFQNTFTEYGFAFVAQEKTPPYASRVYICDADYIKRGYDTFRELIGIYHDCKLSGKWYGYEGADNMPVPLLED